VQVGYSEEQIREVPGGCDMGLGCGNPQAVAGLRPGEIVLDLGSGAGLDSFLAAKQVGKAGRVIGVDMTPEMIAKAQDYARAGDYSNVEFRVGEIENLPMPDSSVDVIISNCVINLSPDKRGAFREAFRVLKSGGRLAISDVVATAPLPEQIRNDLSLYSSCIAGALPIPELEAILEECGFHQIRVRPIDESRRFIAGWVPGRSVEDYVASAVIEAVKPTS